MSSPHHRSRIHTSNPHASKKAHRLHPEMPPFPTSPSGSFTNPTESTDHSLPAETNGPSIHRPEPSLQQGQSCVCMSRSIKSRAFIEAVYVLIDTILWPHGHAGTSMSWDAFVDHPWLRAVWPELSHQPAARASLFQLVSSDPRIYLEEATHATAFALEANVMHVDAQNSDSTAAANASTTIRLSNIDPSVKDKDILSEIKTIASDLGQQILDPAIESRLTKTVHLSFPTSSEARAILDRMSQRNILGQQVIVKSATDAQPNDGVSSEYEAIYYPHLALTPNPSMPFNYLAFVADPYSPCDAHSIRPKQKGPKPRRSRSHNIAKRFDVNNVHVDSDHQVIKDGPFVRVRSKSEQTPSRWNYSEEAEPARRRSVDGQHSTAKSLNNSIRQSRQLMVASGHGSRGDASRFESEDHPACSHSVMHSDAGEEPNSYQGTVPGSQRSSISHHWTNTDVPEMNSNVSHFNPAMLTSYHVQEQATDSQSFTSSEDLSRSLSTDETSLCTESQETSFAALFDRALQISPSDGVSNTFVNFVSESDFPVLTQANAKMPDSDEVHDSASMSNVQFSYAQALKH